MPLDIAPFAAREDDPARRALRLRWEEPRDIHRIVLQFGGDGPMPKARGVAVRYWRRVWPHGRVTAADLARGNIGGVGWKSRDDWFNGDWAPADIRVRTRGREVTITFWPLARREFAELTDFSVAFRQTMQLRIDLPEGCAALAHAQVFTDTALHLRDIAIEGWSPGTLVARSPDRHGGPKGLAAWAVERTPSCLEATGRSARAPGGDRVDVYNGALDELRALTPDEPRLRLKVWCAKPSPRSYDRTIITLRSPAFDVSFRPDDLDLGPIWIPDLGVLVSDAASNLRYSPDLPTRLGAGVSRYDAIASEPEQSLRRALREQPPKEAMHFIIGCEGGRQKFGIAVNGDVFAHVGFVRRVPGADTARLGWEGSAFALRFGWDDWLRSGRRIERGYLPLIESRFSRGVLDVIAEAHATPVAQSFLGPPITGDAPVACLLRLTFVNNGDLSIAIAQPLDFMTHGGSVGAISRNLDPPLQRERLRIDGDPSASSGQALARAVGGAECLRMAVDTGGAGELIEDDGALTYHLQLAAGERHAIVLKVPFLGQLTADEIAALRAKHFESERAEAIHYWEGRLAAGAQIETPEPDVTDFFRAHLTHVLINDDRELGSDRLIGRVSSFSYGNFSNEAIMQIMDLDRRGLRHEARRHLETYLHYQGTAPLPGNFQSREGLFYGSGGYESGGYNQHHGWVLWGLAEHYRFTGDRAWLLEVADQLIAGCDWVIRERQATMRTDAQGRRVLEYGFLPAGSLEDVTEYCYWLSTNALTSRGLTAAAQALAEVGHPHSERLLREAAAYREDLLAGFRESMARSPVARLRDGAYVPHHPSRLYWRGRDFGWIREVLEGSINLPTTVLDPRSCESTSILKDYEDNRYLDSPYGYPLDNFDAQWFSRGGFSMQPNLLYFMPPYLARDEIEHFLRAFFNGFAACWRADIRAMTEHPLPTLADWAGDHFKSSDEAMVAMWLRMMFIQEDGETLYLGRGLPRAWLADPAGVAIRNAATHFGRMSLEMCPCADTGCIVAQIDPPLRKPPARTLLRFRHPRQAPLVSVSVNGRAHEDFDAAKEWVVLPALREPTTVEARFG